MIAATLTALLNAASAVAQIPPGQVVAPQVVSSSAAVAVIRVERLNVFDPAVPGENWWPFRIANKIHFTTREEVVRRELLLSPGDRYTQLRALESERNLRGLGFFRRAEIRSAPRADGTTDLLVRTQDSWTTNVQLSVGTEGGDSFINYGVAEDNLLGYGKSLSFLRSHSGARQRSEVSYLDPRLAGSRFRLTPFYARTNHGDSVGTEVVQPFFSLDSREARGAAWTRTIDESIIYRDGQEYSKFLLANRTVTAGYGARLPYDRRLVQRVEAGWYSQRDQFHALNETVTGTLPASRDMSGPVFGYSWVEPVYIKETYINRMERVEDFNLGNELSLYGGFMGEALGGDRDRWLINAIDQQGFYILPGRFALSQVGVTGRLAQGKWENTLLFTNINLFWKTTWLFPQTWVGHLEANSGRMLDLENNVVLGGNNGLRGYKNNSFVGGRSVLLNAENRFFFPGEYLHLVRFGGAVFFDSGSVVPEGSGFSFSRFKSDVGFGLRASSTRSQSGDVVRLDLAYALNDGPGGSRFVVSLRGRQAFQFFNSSTQRIRQSPGSRLSRDTAASP